MGDRWNTVAVVGCLFVWGCGATQQVRELPVAPTQQAACDALARSWHDTLSSDEIEAQRATFPCAIDLDVDGDGERDRIALILDGERIGFAVWRWSEASWEYVGTENGSSFQYMIDDEPDAFDGDFSFVVAWKRSTKRIEQARGDALWVSGSDAAAVFYLGDGGWVLSHLGY